ncbi:MAG: hypothetical protein ACI4D3_14655 [Lachnospiraceae bacterium]
MPKWIIQGIMTNLRSWIQFEENPLFCNFYIEYYNALKSQETPHK